MKRKYMLKKESEITFVFKSKRRFGNSFFTIYYLKPAPSPHFKFALSVGKKYGKAHERNLIKRRLRAIIHSYSSYLSSDFFFVVVIKPSARTLKFCQLKSFFFKFISKISLLFIKKCNKEFI